MGTSSGTPTSAGHTTRPGQARDPFFEHGSARPALVATDIQCSQQRCVAAPRALGINRSTLYRKREALGGR